MSKETEGESVGADGCADGAGTRDGGHSGEGGGRGRETEGERDLREQMEGGETARDGSRVGRREGRDKTGRGEPRQQWLGGRRGENADRTASGADEATPKETWAGSKSRKGRKS